MLEYELNKKDCYNFGKEAFKIKRIKKKYSFLFYIPLFFIIASIISLFFPSYKVVYFLFNTTIVLIVICLYIKLLLFMKSTIGMYRYLKKRSLKVNLNVDETGIKYSRGNVSSNIPWNSIIDIYNTKNTLFIFISKIEAIFVPKRIFADEKELNNFWNTIVENYKKTH